MKFSKLNRTDTPPRVKKNIGKKFNRLKIIKFYGKSNKRAFVLCECSCGCETVIEYDKIINQNTKSCGCYRVEWLKRDRKTYVKNINSN